jgi:predicted permease
LLRNSSWGNTVRFEGTDADTTPRSDFTAPGLFATLGIPVILGREFTARDVRGAQPVAIINEVVAKKYFPGQNPLGRHVFVGRDPGFDIVGVVKTVHTDNLREPLREFVYRPLLTTQNLGAVTFYLRTATPPATLAGLIRATVKELEPNLAVYRLTTAEDDVTNLLVGQRLMAQLTTAFGLLATVLAAIGLYGVLSYTVTRRTREIGIRMALGAGAAKVTRLVLRDVAVLTAIGAAIALPAAYGLCRLMQAVLFGISGSEPVLFATATVLLALVALAAGFLPAHRATKVDPNEALRSE